ncbi:hypothetical protein M430DRAFT_131619, partial [Amorphotheca resinae ATCC 22711]
MLAGSGTYALMVKSRAGTCQQPTLQDFAAPFPKSHEAQFESRFNSQDQVPLIQHRRPYSTLVTL